MIQLAFDYQGSLGNLLAECSRHLHRADQVLMRLPRGAQVIVARRPVGELGRMVTIERAERPTTADGWKKWEIEVATFRKHLRLERWEPVTVPASAPDGNRRAVPGARGRAMTARIQLARELTVGLDVVTQTLAAIGRKGAGKTYLATVLAEQMLDAGAQLVAIDPVGNFWGLRVAADGKGRGKDIFVLGGEHGDVPLVPEAGRQIARLLVERRLLAAGPEWILRLRRDVRSLPDHVAREADWRLLAAGPEWLAPLYEIERLNPPLDRTVAATAALGQGQSP